ncbi:antiviral reverse transcriptase Drt3a [Gabonibacter chumensis]|uniref:antiviral reverse transcriptase Drt3a n=1 Tax=Gabonibacter chumensis TaxID=2972474 RepID=UPI0025731BE5|nr:antiviral reverse transcriptase Drt3a [Gabonibacter chumensis]MCR9010837.1 reverse transcriptase domain-containing protein [Gabonibacter chumensis]
MLDQSFSAKNFEDIFNRENRKGNINPELLSDEYKVIIENLKKLNQRQKEIFSKKKNNWTKEEKIEIKNLKDAIQAKQQNKQKSLEDYFKKIEKLVNQSSFRIKLNVKKDDEHKDLFFINKDDEKQFFVIKCLQRNIYRTFKVKQANRHVIMTQLKLLLNESLPKYIIRTDVTHFFESISQERLFQKIETNTLLSNKSKTLIKAIVKEYENLKDKTQYDLKLGIPRGIGVSSYLSELYMKDIDREISGREEILYYVRYVDDIFLILSSLPMGQSLEEYYNGLKSVFKQEGLDIKDSNDPEKCQLINVHDKFSGSKNFNIKYLGYQIKVTKDDNGLHSEFNMTQDKIGKLKKRIEFAFEHFKSVSQSDIKKARRDLLDCLNYISGNYRLSKYKSGIKAGIYYSNDLLDNTKGLDNLTHCLHNINLDPYVKLFEDSDARNEYIKKMKKLIEKIDFKERWKNKQMYNFSVHRLKEIGQWLDVKK